MRSISSSVKKEELEIFILDNSIDLVAITESWTTDKILDSELNIPGFSLYRRDRYSETFRRGGGVLLYVNNLLNVVELLDVNKGNCEALWCKIVLDDVEVIIGVCYRSMNATDEENHALF